MKPLMLLAVALGLAACVPSPSPAPVPPDATDAAPTPPPAPQDAAPTPAPAVDASPDCQAACARLAAVGCALGTSVHCLEAMQILEDFHLRKVDGGHTLTCAMLAGAQSLADVQRLGLVCP